MILSAQQRLTHVPSRLSTVEPWAGRPPSPPARCGAGPGPYGHGWKGTLDLRPVEQATVIVRFDGYRGRYVFHCHSLEHEDWR